ncbi:ADP-ribosylglycohydrolase family protein [Arabiibacter massiliensis]|uniref:ADP-ribosylglycohydrolase family protein n=1 Tax=Arabiibacter massiliensis TaxID=1870985 RepID=UPI0009B9D1DD|nr:ADP-ribosylglycohydrolase family protein [Arabiibacter massiliensis]
MKSLLRDAIYGLAVGDALGVPGEFQGRDSYRIGGMVGGGAHGKPAGTFSDDTSMTLATCDSIRACGGVDVDDMRERFRAWLRNGDYAVDGDVFDVGMTVSRSLSLGRGLDGERDNGNGSLMRIVPLAFVDGVTDEQIEAASAITHAHERSRRACVVYVRLAQELAAGRPVLDALRSLPAAEPFERLPRMDQVPREDVRSTGYVIDTLEAALWALATTSSFEECTLAAVNLGNDTDTVGAVSGALAGIVYGFDAIPATWIETLRGKEIIESCLF